MKLTGKCKKDFDKWYESLEDYYHLELMPDNMVYGVYQDFFDSVGIYICEYHIDKGFTYMVDVKGYTYLAEYYKTRQEGRKKSIIKANNIHNEN
jgi:hypothetical protein